MWETQSGGPKPIRRSQQSPGKPYSVPGFLACSPLLLHHSQTIPHFPLRVRSVIKGCRVNRRGLPGTVGPVLMSSDMPAVATPPAYKCTCSSKKPPYCTTSLCPLNGTSVLCCETSNRIPKELLSSGMSTRMIRRSRTVQSHPATTLLPLHLVTSAYATFHLPKEH